jgi:hypothetical protein
MFSTYSLKQSRSVLNLLGQQKEFASPQVRQSLGLFGSGEHEWNMRSLGLCLDRKQSYL